MHSARLPKRPSALRSAHRPGLLLHLAVLYHANAFGANCENVAHCASKSREVEAAAASLAICLSGAGREAKLLTACQRTAACMHRG